MPIASLDSNGDHEYNLKLQADATVVVRSGTASFHQRLRSVSISGQGSVKALRAMSDCHVEIAGDLEVHRELVDSEIIIRGLLETIGQPVSANETCTAVTLTSVARWNQSAKCGARARGPRPDRAGRRSHG